MLSGPGEGAGWCAVWERGGVVAALGAEAGALAPRLLGVSEEEAVRPTRCEPWDVAALSVHTVGALARVGDALEGPVPDGGGARVSAAGYYRPDVRFSAQVNADRVQGAVEVAARRADAAEPGRVLVREWRVLRQRLVREPVDRLVRTRHGDVMLLTDFLVTRVVELVLHGLDLADALGRDPWASAEGVAVVEELLFAQADPGALGAAGLSGLALVRAATGRGPAADARGLRSAGVRFLALG